MVKSKLAKKLLVFFIAACLFLVACNASSEVEGATPQSLPAGVTEPAATNLPELAPGFTLTTLTGDELSLSDYEGEWVILNFWATWCPPCISEMPYLQTLANSGLNVLGVNVAEEEGQVKLFIVKHGIKFPILMEPDGNLILDYQARQLPRTFIIAPDGTIALRISGPIEGEQLDPWLEEHSVQ